MAKKMGLNYNNRGNMLSYGDDTYQNKKYQKNQMSLGYDEDRRGHYVPNDFRGEDQEVPYGYNNRDIAPTIPGRAPMNQNRDRGV